MCALLALAGDTMLGRGVAERLRDDPAGPLFDGRLADAVAAADLFVLNLECCISERGEPFPDPGKPFFFRAPPAAADALASLGVDCVTLANNHALDFGPTALLDTFGHLARAGIAWVGAGPEVDAAREARVIGRRGLRLRVVGVSDHPRAYAATASDPGIAFADLRSGTLPDWLRTAVAGGRGDCRTLVTPHWGPNMRDTPLPEVRAAAAALREAGATVIAGHSAHIFQGVIAPTLFDLGGFVDDYAVDEGLRNDLGLLFLVELDTEVRRIEALPLRLDYCHTRLAIGDEVRAVERLFTERCTALGTRVRRRGDRLIVEV